MNAVGKANLAKCYQEHLTIPNNIQYSDWVWIGRGPTPLDYSLLLQDEKESCSASIFTVIGTVFFVEKDRFKTLIHVNGFDPYIADANIWACQIRGMLVIIIIAGVMSIRNAFPLVNGQAFDFQVGYVSDNYIVFRLKHASTLHEKNIPTTVTDIKDEVVVLKSDDYSKDISKGSLVQVSFIPYAWSQSGQNSITLSPKNVKVIKPNFVSASALSDVEVIPLIPVKGPATPKTATKTLGSVAKVATTNLGF